MKIAKQKEEKTKQNSALKIILAVVVIVGSLAYGLKAFWAYNRGIQEPIQSPARAEMPNPAVVYSASHPSNIGLEDMKPLPLEDFKAIRRKMVDRMGLTIPQRLELRKIWYGAASLSPLDLQERFRQTGELLDSNQVEILQETLQERIPWRVAERMNTAQRVLPKEQYEIYQKRVQQRANEFGQALSILMAAVEEKESAR